MKKLKEENNEELENQEKEIIDPISEEDFQKVAEQLSNDNHLRRVKEFEEDGTLSFREYSSCSKYKSVRRAIKRGHLSIYGDHYPKRPFSNKKRKKGTWTDDRRVIHKEMKHIQKLNQEKEDGRDND